MELISKIRIDGAFIAVALAVLFFPVLETAAGETLNEARVIELLPNANLGVAEAQFQLGIIYLSAGQASVAAPWVKKSATQGYSRAQYVLAVMHKEGAGVAKDHRLAFSWALKSAENGNIRGQDLVGELYAAGTGVERSYHDAAKWFRKAAESGFKGSATNLATLYANGKGVSRNLALAKQWVQRDLKKSHPPAKQLLSWIEKVQAAEKNAPQPRITVQRGLSAIPIPIPPSMYTKELKALHNRPLSDSAEIAASLEQNITSLTPPYLYELARRTLDTNLQESFTWYWVGVIRAHYDAGRCSDRTSRQGVRYLPRLVPRVVNAIRGNEKIAQAAAAKALERENSFPADSNPYWICIHGMKAISAALKNSPLKNWKTPETEWPALREKIRASVKNFVKNGLSTPKK